MIILESENKIRDVNFSRVWILSLVQILTSVEIHSADNNSIAATSLRIFFSTCLKIIEDKTMKE